MKLSKHFDTIHSFVLDELESRERSFLPGPSPIEVELIGAAQRAERAITEAREISDALLHSLQWLMAMLDCGTLVRNIERDMEPDFAIRMVGFVTNLKKAAAAIAKAEGKS